MWERGKRGGGERGSRRVERGGVNRREDVVGEEVVKKVIDESEKAERRE